MSRFAFAATLLFASTLAAPAQEGRSIALILDASGSMNAKLGTGGTRIEAAKAAVAAFVAKLDPNLRISYRVYGHQSPTRERNCKDTELLVDFAPAAANRAAILAKTQAIKAQGYTPITHVIQLAATDIAQEPGSRTVVLVSDGKETCPGDPCAAAKALAAADARLTIHTIGFNVDAAARFQLQCMARVARGTYSDASGAADLGARLGAAVAAKPEPPPSEQKPVPQKKTTITIVKPKPGRLQIKNPDFRGHRVTEAETEKAFGVFHNMTFMELPAGIYNVAFGPTLWRSVEVRAGETTVLDPGVLVMPNASNAGHKVLDWETGVEVGSISHAVNSLSVMPSTFTVMFGNARWDNIEVEAGERKVLNPAVIVVNGASGAGHRVLADDGTLVAVVSSFGHILPVPPGQYTIEIEGQTVPLDLQEGQRMEINVK
ncbi:MAG: VWA domain-containing protein [Xanthobacteraceae bacterium]|nr:VWA domain-containing protein [Xanthobacteraceae bacterium]